MIDENYITDKIFCTRFESRDMMNLPDNMPDIRKTYSMISDPEIISLKIIDTVQGMSSEGKTFTGKMIAVEIKTKKRVLYVADVQNESMHMLENVSYEIGYIIAPQLILGTELEALIESKYLKSRVKIEEVITKKIHNRTIFVQIICYIELRLLPTHQLCYSVEKDDKNSEIFITYEDGTSKKQITNCLGIQNIKPQWSPLGDRIAFLSASKDEFMLNIVTLKNQSVKRITDPMTFNSISSFDWSKNGKYIIFAASRGKDKELFIIDVENQSCRQLTDGKDISKSFIPKYSPNGKKVAFLRSVTGITNLNIMDSDGLNCISIPLGSHVKDFAWSSQGEHIACILRDSNCDKICLLDLDKYNKRFFNIPNSIVQIRNIKFSSNDLLIAFIGTDIETENIYTYILDDDNIKNITGNYCNVQIGDFTWKIDSSVIYYSANDLYYYNIYCVHLENHYRYQLTNVNASYIYLNYRPKIK